jgi:NAD(P)-dependent dehydrogenase (short-subunit alcohol dehydrogenase family)
MNFTQTTLNGHIALVTGARRGIGRAIAQRLAAHGAKVVIASRTTKDEGVEETLALIRDAGGQAAVEPLELSSTAARAGFIARAAAHFGPIDILVNNAATNNHQKPSVMDNDYRHKLFEVNFHAAADLIQQALPAMRERGYGRIINITSAGATVAEIPYSGASEVIQGLVMYGASKAALDRFTVGLATELHGTGIHANALLPSAVVVTGGSSPGALAHLRKDPSAAESLEMMAEAAFLLIAAPLTGLVIKSRRVLEMLQQPLHALNGKTVIGDAMTIPQF